MAGLDDNEMKNNNTRPTAPWMRYGTAPKMGLRMCDEADWLLERDYFGNEDATQQQIALKAELCRTDHETIFQYLPEADDASAELLKMIDRNLQTFHQRDAENNPSRHPLDNAGRSLAEDLCLLAPTGNSAHNKWVLTAGFLGFPAHWSLAEKLNHPIGKIHAPVPDYDTNLENPVNRFFDKMVAGPISKRHNWTLQIDDGLFTPNRAPASLETAEDVPVRLHVRVETQTLRKLPQTGWIIFTIRTAIAPLSRWADDSEALNQLQKLTSNLSPAMRQYRGVHSYETKLKEWVNRR